MPPPVDAELVRAAQAGDREALGELLTDYLPVVYNFVGHALHRHADVDDVVQETMMRAVQRLESLRDPHSFRAWLISIAARQVKERDRSRLAAQARAEVWDETSEPADPGGDFVDELVARHRLSGERRAVVEASRWLGAQDRRVLSLWWQEAAGVLTRAEVADALALSIPHAGVRIQRMRVQLARVRAVLAAWRASPRCAGFTAAARGWEGQADSRWLKRLSRHVRDCDACLGAAQGLSPERDLLAGIGLLPVPLLLAELKTVPAAHFAATSWLPHVFTARRVAVAAAGFGAAALTAAVLLQPLPHKENLPAVMPPPVPSVTSSAAPSAAPVTAAPSPSAVVSSTIYLSPKGSDAGDGSAQRPYATLGKAVSVVRPGQTIVARGGTYRPIEPVRITTDGTAQQRITLTASPGERPVFDASGVPPDRWFITHEADHWTVRGLEIHGARNHPYVCRSCQYDVFERLYIHDNQQIGLLLRDQGTIGNQVLDSDFLFNHDDAGNGASADGLAFKYGAGKGNVVRGCRMAGNTDDGLDLHDFADPVTVDRSWAYENGVDHWNDPAIRVTGAGNGFRLGGGSAAKPVAHVVTNSAAWDNAGYGFTESANRGSLRLTNNTAFRNAKDGFAFYYSTALLRNNLALSNHREAVLAEVATEEGNSWNQPGWATETLHSTDPVAAKGPRAPDGSLPPTTFLTNTRDTAVGAPMPSA